MQNSHGELRTERSCKRIIPAFVRQEVCVFVEGKLKVVCACLLCNR